MIIGIALFWLKTKPLNKHITIADTRILLTEDNIAEYNTYQTTDCQEKFNSEPANTTFRYTSADKGIEFDLPYNPNWGSNRFRISRYWEREDHLAFGTIHTFEGCSWVRSHHLYFRPAYDADTVIRHILESDPPELLPITPTVVQINDLTVVKYATSGLCSYPTLQIIGSKYNYEFVPTCSTHLEADLEYLENIVKTVKLIE